MFRRDEDAAALGRRLREGDTRVLDALIAAGAREELRSALTSESEAVREDAASGLAEIGDPGTG